MSAMDLLCEPKTLVAEIGKLFSKVCNFRHFGDATFSIFALQLGGADKNLDLILLKYQEVYDVLIRTTKESR